VLAEEDFIERIKARMKKQGSRREQPGVKQLEAVDPGTILKKELKGTGYFFIER
jgi:hypothetical protein